MSNFTLYFIKQQKINLPLAFKQARREFCKEWKPIIITGYKQVGGISMDLNGDFKICISVEWDDSLVKNEKE